jgi:hypothetical protein
LKLKDIHALLADDEASPAPPGGLVGTRQKRKNPRRFGVHLENPGRLERPKEMHQWSPSPSMDNGTKSVSRPTRRCSQIEFKFLEQNFRFPRESVHLSWLNPRSPFGQDLALPVALRERYPSDWRKMPSSSRSSQSRARSWRGFYQR